MIRKFRVYDKHLKLVKEVTSIDFKNREIWYSINDDGITIQRSFDEVNIMQSTGFFDKTGIEIFEEDILKASSFANWIGEVRYSPETQAYMFFDTWEECKKRNIFLNQFDQLEVVGNIYENKELLNE